MKPSPSTNIEIECLGKTAQYGSPETQSALNCLQEVSRIRDKVVSAIVARMPERESLSSTSPSQILAAQREDSEYFFGNMTLNYESIKEFETLKTKDTGSWWSGEAKDTFEGREIEFHQQMQDALIKPKTKDPFIFSGPAYLKTPGSF